MFLNYFHAIGKVNIYIYIYMLMLFPVFAPICQKYSRLPLLLTVYNTCLQTTQLHAPVDNTCWLYGALNTILEANAYNVPAPESQISMLVL